MSVYIVVHNDGPEIEKTNYWESEYNLNGIAYLTINAGCFSVVNWMS